MKMTKKTPAIETKSSSSCALGISGSKCKEFTSMTTHQAIRALWPVDSKDDTISKQIQAVVSSMRGINPQDEIEGMLATQMIGLHNAAMECMRRAMMQEQTFNGRNCNLSQANKLSRSYATLVESLQKYRGKGQQKMTVEHVHVNKGGQAIIGNVNNNGGSKNIKTEEQPHAKVVDND